jgi:DNA polymerase (family 10)
MTNEQLAQEFEALRNLLIIGGYPQEKVGHYARLVVTLRRLPIPVVQLAKQGRLCDIPGVGVGLAATISEYLMNGTCRRRQEWERRVPASLLHLLKIPGVGLQTVRYLYQTCGIESVEQLESAVCNGTLLPMNRRIAGRLRTYFTGRTNLHNGQGVLSFAMDGE